jgi:hypothetical protein
MSREIPILFNSAMVRANRAGLKWQTRRRVKPDPKFPHHNILKYGLPYAADASAVWWHSLETDRVGDTANCVHLSTCPAGLAATPTP